jgi:phosphoribosylformylglycinamidine synthase PurS subunit
MLYHASVLVFLKEGVLDTQGKAVGAVLHDAGHAEVRDVRIGKYIRLRIEAPSLEDATRSARTVCDDLLVNGIIEEFTVDVREEDDA